MTISALSASAVAAALRPWGLSVEGECQVATKGVENTNIFFVSGGGRWVLRLHTSTPFARVRRQTQILESLASSSLPVPRLCRDRRGNCLAWVWGHPATVSSFVDGEDLEHRTLSVATASAIGALVGRVDRALARIPAALTNEASPPPPPHELTSLGETHRRLTKLLRDNRSRPNAGSAGVVVPWERIAAALDAIATQAIADRWRRLPRQLIHGDVSAQNLLHDEGTGRLTGLVDFGDVVTSARVADIAVTIGHLGVSGRRIREDIWGALWSGWSDVVSPTSAEQAALPSLLTSRFVKLVVDHVWRERFGRPHPGHRALIATGIGGLHALAAWQRDASPAWPGPPSPPRRHDDARGVGPWL